MRFYEGANSFVANTVEITPTGEFIIGGSIIIEGDVRTKKMLVIRTDAFGQKKWEKIIDGGSLSSLKLIGDEVVIVGDSVKQEDLITRTTSRLVILNSENGTPNTDRSYYPWRNGQRVDFHATGITDDGVEGNYIVLGTRKIPGKKEEAVITAINRTSFDTTWSTSYDYLDRDYRNVNSVFQINGSVIWGATLVEGANAKTYLTLPVLDTVTNFSNSIYFGEETNKLSHRINDLQRSGSGFCAVGTYSEFDGTKSNLFFIKANSKGTFDKNSVRYFDGVISKGKNVPLDETSEINLSEIEDSGQAVTRTRDGGYLVAGNIVTNVQRGNGGRDIWLIKLNADGIPLWDKIIGGPSNETVAAVRAFDSGEIVICGTIQDGEIQTGGLSSIFLIKTDAQGNLIN